MDNREEGAVILALLHQEGGVGKTTLALHPACEWSREGKRVTFIHAESSRAFSSGLGDAASDPDSWIRAPDRTIERGAIDAFTARLTIDVRPAPRGRIKGCRRRRGLTVADMLRDLFVRECPDDGGAAP